MLFYSCEIYMFDLLLVCDLIRFVVIVLHVHFALCRKYVIISLKTSKSSQLGEPCSLLLTLNCSSSFSFVLQTIFYLLPANLDDSVPFQSIHYIIWFNCIILSFEQYAVKLKLVQPMTFAKSYRVTLIYRNSL